MIKPKTRPQPQTKTERGFSLIELLIVVSVILIIAGIAIPNFMRSRMRANEVAAVQNLRTITTANTIYLTTYGIGFADGLPQLSGNVVVVDSNNAGLIDTVLATGFKNGYTYTYRVTARDTQNHPVAFSITAEPTNIGVTGDRFFYVDQSGIVRFNVAGAAGPGDSSI